MQANPRNNPQVGCRFNPQLKTTVHKFGLALRVCECQRVHVPLSERSFGYGSKGNASPDRLKAQLAARAKEAKETLPELD